MIWHRSLRYTTFPTRRWTSTPGPRKTSWSTGPTRPTPCSSPRTRWSSAVRWTPGAYVYTASLEVLTQLTGFHLTRGMLCAMRRPPLPSVAEVCARARRIAVLENVMNPTNVGAIFRCAAALGMDAVLLTTEGSDPLYRRASRVSMGNVFLVPWTYLPEGDWTAALHDLGFTTAAMALREDSLRLDDPRLLSAERLAVVLGTEGDGLADGTIAQCDHTVMIPMTHGVDSLNVAAAAAVAFYQLGLQCQ